jgi:hypothetical protein
MIVYWDLVRFAGCLAIGVSLAKIILDFVRDSW